MSVAWYPPGMKRDEAIRQLKKEEGALRALGVRALFLFGSTARDEARADSDVDIFIDYDKDRLGLIELARLQRELSEALGRAADIGTRDSLHPQMREGIERDAVAVF